TVRVWNANTGAMIAGPSEGHTEAVRSVVFRRSIASGSDDRTLCVWNANTGAMIAGPFKDHTRSVSSVAVLPDGQSIASGSNDRTVRVWSTTTNDMECNGFTDQSIINQDGWVTCGSSSLLLWIPPLHRVDLHRPRNVWIHGLKHDTVLDLQKFVHGRDWAQCFVEKF
ncbi:WD40 repeat-like protein, partial [Auriscalpium vulgare]